MKKKDKSKISVFHFLGGPVTPRGGFSGEVVSVVLVTHKGRHRKYGKFERAARSTD